MITALVWLQKEGFQFAHVFSAEVEPRLALTISLVNSSPLPALISVFLAVCSSVITELSWTTSCLLQRTQLWPGYHGDACSIHTIGRRVRTLPLLQRDIINGNVPLDPWTADALKYHLRDGNRAQNQMLIARASSAVDSIFERLCTIP